METRLFSSDLEWKSISDERYRTYLFPVEGQFFAQLAEITIYNPSILNVNYKSGGHRIIDEDGKSYYIPAGWICLFWESHEDSIPTYQF